MSDIQQLDFSYFPGCSLAGHATGVVKVAYAHLRRKLPDTGIMLNCCGEHSLVVTKDAATGEFELAETDDPVRLDNGEVSRCLCMCRFDFKVNVPNVTGAIKVKLTLKVNPYGDLPDEPRKTLWEGELNLSAGSGSELNTAREGYECSP